MASLLDPPDDYGRVGQTSLLLPSDSADVGGFLDYLGKQIGDENLRRAGVGPDVARFWQGAVAEHPELRLPAAPSPVGPADLGMLGLAPPPPAVSDPYQPFNPQAAIDRINQRAMGDIGTQIGSAFEGGLKVPTRAGNIARVDVRGPNNELLDVKPMTGRAVGSLLDEHLAAGGVPLYGGRAGEGADITVTLPPGVTSAAELAARSRQMVDQATLMTQGVPEGMTPPRYWYQAGGGALHDLTGQDLEAAQRLAAAHAITSPQTNVSGNANFATNAWNQSLLGGPIAVTNAQRNAALEEALYGDILPSSRKTGPFFENHMRYLDPAYANNITNDIWQMRQAGFQNPDGAPFSGRPGVGEDNYVRLMVERATRQLNADGVDGGGWTPDQVQAALWTHAKTLQETGTPSAASINFLDALNRLQAGQGNAHRAGPALLGPAASDPQAQAAFAQSGLLTDPLGRDIVNASLGLLTPSGKPGVATVSMTADGINPASRTLMDASSLIRATLLRQPSALWTAVPDVKGLPSYANANLVHALSPDPEHALALRTALDDAGGGLEHAVLGQTPGGVQILNVGERTGLTNPDFQSAVKSAITDAGLPADLKRGRADYGYFTHDWTADPTGAGYVAALGRLPPHLQRVGDQLFARLGGRLDAAGSALSGASAAHAGGPTGPWTVPGFAQAVGPADLPLPLRPWVQRASPDDPGSALASLLAGATP